MVSVYLFRNLLSGCSGRYSVSDFLSDSDCSVSCFQIDSGYSVLCFLSGFVRSGLYFQTGSDHPKGNSADLYLSLIHI